MKNKENLDKLKEVINQINNLGIKDSFFKMYSEGITKKIKSRVLIDFDKLFGTLTPFSESNSKELVELLYNQFLGDCLHYITFNVNTIEHDVEDYIQSSKFDSFVLSPYEAVLFQEKFGFENSKLESSNQFLFQEIGNYKGKKCFVLPFLNKDVFFLNYGDFSFKAELINTDDENFKNVNIYLTSSEVHRIETKKMEFEDLRIS